MMVMAVVTMVVEEGLHYSDGRTRGDDGDDGVDNGGSGSGRVTTS
jgi:hypothetical protein